MQHSRTKTALLARVNNALCNMYHNATPYHPCNVPESLRGAYDSWFNMVAEGEIESLRETPITTYGKLYTWGRGGRTLAPEKLVRERGGSGFSLCSADDFADSCNAELTHMAQVVEAFNDYVMQWCSCDNLSAMWREECENERNTLADCAKDARLALRQLARDAKALAGVAGEAACNVLRREIAIQRAHHKTLVQKMRDYKQV